LDVVVVRWVVVDFVVIVFFQQRLLLSPSHDINRPRLEISVENTMNLCPRRPSHLLHMRFAEMTSCLYKIFNPLLMSGARRNRIPK
jgi:hypothetical protein